MAELQTPAGWRAFGELCVEYLMDVLEHARIESIYAAYYASES